MMGICPRCGVLRCVGHSLSIGTNGEGRNPVMRTLCILSGLTLLLTSPAVRADQAEDEALLRGASVTPDGPGLLAYFQSRVARSEADETRIAALVEKLANERFKEREKASAELIALGHLARPFLIRAAEHKDV